MADLKYRGYWGAALDDFTNEVQDIEPGDDTKYVYLFKDNGDAERFLFTRSMMEGREIDIMVVVAGGNAGRQMALSIPYGASTTAVTKVINEPTRTTS